MALAFKRVRFIRAGNLRGAVVEASNDATATAYPSGGFAMDPRIAGIQTVVYAQGQMDNGGRVWVYDYQNNKWKVFKFDYANAAAGPAIELQTTDTIPANSTRRMIVLGY